MARADIPKEKPMRHTALIRSLALATLLVLPAAAPAAAEGKPSEGLWGWLAGVTAWLEKAGNWIDPNGGRAVCSGDAGNCIDPNGAPAADLGDAGGHIDPNGAKSACYGDEGNCIDPDGRS
jgi:hypothetical protein